MEARKILKTCKYCGIVQYNHVCPQRRFRERKNTEIEKFRCSNKWQNKRDEIKKRDLYLCQICIREIYNTVIKYNSKELSVHHNIPIKEDYDKRLDNNNLITVCNYHHELCEKGEISREQVQEIINKQEEKLG